MHYYTTDSGGSRSFPGGHKPLGAVLGYNFIKFSEKLHEIEKNLVAGGACARGAPLDPPLTDTQLFILSILN